MDLQYLHSNMVRFIIDLSQEHIFTAEAFTFQYGQIYYYEVDVYKDKQPIIYIPIWLDLLQELYKPILKRQIYLHSNMVRFIIGFCPSFTLSNIKFTFQYGQIYYE